MSTDLGCSRGEKDFSWEGDVWAWLKMACASVSLLGPLDLNIFRRLYSHAQKRMKGKLKKKTNCDRRLVRWLFNFPVGQTTITEKSRIVLLFQLCGPPCQAFMINIVLFAMRITQKEFEARRRYSQLKVAEKEVKRKITVKSVPPRKHAATHWFFNPASLTNLFFFRNALVICGSVFGGEVHNLELLLANSALVCLLQL